ncbi:MAG: hypothetical protein JSS70_20725 [Bacteroidetes bacterium]|nr:hypothetical protein [Bacteroidota bacterium]
MKKSAILKIITLLIFFSLLAVFVFYRSDYFNRSNKNEQKNSENDLLVKKIVDSIVHERNSRKQLRLSSSKSIVINERFPDDSLVIRFLKDSIEKELLKIENSKTKK